MDKMFNDSFMSKLSENDIASMYSTQAYMKKVNNNEYIPFTDLEEQKALERYNRLIKYINSKNITLYKQDSFNEYDKLFILDTFYDIIFYLFGCNESIVNEIASYIKNMTLNYSEEVLDGYSFQMINQKTKELKYSVRIPNLTNLSAIVCLTHEFIHYHFQINNIESKIFQYGEILSIYAEKVASHIVQERKYDSEIEKKIENVRLDAITWHNVFYKEEIKKMYNLYRTIDEPKIKNMYFDHKRYSTALAQSYGIGYIYAENLYQNYLTDSKNTTDKIMKVLYNEESLESLLKYYNISTSNKNTYDNTKIKIKSLFK